MAVVTKKIHRKLIARLLLGWCALSILIGSAVYFIEIKKVDDFVVNLEISGSLMMT